MNEQRMKNMYRYYGVTPVTVNAKMEYRPTWDSIVYVEGRRSIKVERWQIEYYADVIGDSLNASNENVGGYFDFIRSLLDQPIFWEYFSDEERTQMLDKIIEEGEFARNIAHWSDDKSGLFVYDGLNEYGHYRFVRFDVGHDRFGHTLRRAFRFMDDRDRISGNEYVDASDENAEREALVAQLLKHVKRLNELGMTEQDILARMRGDDPTAVHTLVVSSDYKLYVSRYYEQEIKMSPLDKAVYLLFLRHPEGINFSYLPD